MPNGISSGAAKTESGDTARHALISDLPGYPSPPRVRDIPRTPGSWGQVKIFSPLAVAMLDRATVVYDELGHLWVNGDLAPCGKIPDGQVSNPGAIVYNAAHGLGLWIHPKSYGYLPSTSRLDLHREAGGVDRWIAVTEIAATIPPAAARYNATLAALTAGESAAN